MLHDKNIDIDHNFIDWNNKFIKNFTKTISNIVLALLLHVILYYYDTEIHKQSKIYILV